MRDSDRDLTTKIIVRKDSGMFKVADLKGKRVTMGYSAMRNIDKTVRAMLASAGLTEADVRPVLVDPGKVVSRKTTIEN